MRYLLPTIVALLMATGAAWAQTGKIIGKVVDDTGEPVVGAQVKFLKNGQFKAAAQADLEGNYKSSPLEPGRYEVEASFSGFDSKKVTGINVGAEKSTVIDIKLTVGSTEVVELVEYKVPVFDKDNTTEGRRFTAEEIRRLPTRDLTTIAATTPGVYSSDEGQGLNIRGNRSGDNATFVNGVRINGSVLPPPEALEEAAVLTGGIPAQYGDLLGGVQSYTTKSAARRFSGGAILETSRPFDQWNYDLAGVTLSGPLVRKKETVTLPSGMTQTYERTLLGYFLNAQYTGYKTRFPSPYGYYILSDEAANRMKTTPYTVQPGSNPTRYIHNGFFYTEQDLRRVDYRPNDQQHSANVVFNLDYQPTENTLLSVGGTGSYGLNNNGINFNPANYDRQSQTTSWDFNGFVRFRQTFNSGSENQDDLIKNIFYQVQFDVNRDLNVVQDARHKNNLSYYNYYGKFVQNYTDETIQGPTGFLRFNRFDPSTGSNDSMFLFTQVANANTLERRLVLRNQFDGLTFIPGTQNAVLANYNTYLSSLDANYLGDANFLDLQTGALTQLGFGTNGGTLNRVGYTYRNKAATFGNYTAYGVNLSGYQISNTDQYRATLQMGADVGRHSIKFGIEALQRISSSYVGPTNLYSRGRGLLNRQILGEDAGLIVDTNTVRQTVVDPDGTSRDVNFTYVSTQRLLNRDANGNILGQSDFDRNLRIALGKDPNGSELINIDEIDPDQININLFSVNDILDDGNRPFAFWNGYDAYGNRKAVFGGRTSFSDFFTDTINRPIDAFRPVYLAGYVEDKFEIDDLIMRIGFRFDRFDANTQVLRDPYSLTRLRTVGETDFSQFSGNTQRPGNIGDDYVVYVDRSADEFNGTNQDQFRVVGYRSGNQFFLANGSPTNNPRDLEVGGDIFPWYDVTGIQDPTLRRLQRNNRITLDAFEQFRPDWLISPRISFSFPISEDALFFAHYDILTQRPLSYTGANNYATPLDYYALSRTGSFVYDNSPAAGAFISNPNLKPQRKIDYQVGFKQRLTTNSALNLSAYYQEIKDLIQVIRVTSAFPITYTTDGNQDFGVSQGFTVEYDRRQNQNLTMNASYTLQFAETSASAFAASQLAQTNNPNLRNTVPASFDSRHGLKLTMDYRYAAGAGPELFGGHPFGNAGLNVIVLANSGTPYTRYEQQFQNDNILGAVNGNRIPWNTRVNVRVNKVFALGGKLNVETNTPSRQYLVDAYIYVSNLLDRRNVLSVYNRSGSATDDGYLSSSLGRQEQSQAFSPETYALYYNLAILNPNLISLPRWVRIGASLSF